MASLKRTTQLAFGAAALAATLAARRRSLAQRADAAFTTLAVLPSMRTPARIDRDRRIDRRRRRCAASRTELGGKSAQVGSTQALAAELAADGITMTSRKPHRQAKPFRLDAKPVDPAQSRGDA